MADGDIAEGHVEGYLEAVSRQLVGPRTVRAAILAELRDGLHEAVAAQVRCGHSTEGAVHTALREFGAPTAVAAGFAGELARGGARWIAVGYLLTGPVIGLLWLLVLAPSGWWLGGPIGLWSVVPAIPAVGVSVLVGFGVLAATGRLSRWMPLPDPYVVDAAGALVAVAVVADVVVLARMASGTFGPVLLVGLAAAASVIRIGLGVGLVVRGVGVRQALSGP